MPVIPVTGEAEIGRMMVQGQPQGKSLKDPAQSIIQA
jgi:hypothetical protein